MNVLPAAPTITATAASTSQINIAITPQASNGGTPITSYKVYRNGVYNGSTTTTLYSARGLTVNTSYSFTVSAVNDIGEGAKSSEGTAKTLDVAPNAPTFTATATSTSQINIAITAPASNGGTAITSYKVYLNGVYKGSTTTTSFPATGLSANTSYSFTVSAVNDLGEGTQSSAASATTQAPPPSDVTNIRTGWEYLPLPGRAFIEWDPPAYDGGFPIVRYDLSGKKYHTDEDWSGSTTISQIYTAGLNLRSIKVKAVNAIGASSGWVEQTL